ncbi:sigma-54-dependent transcriptional regulator variant [Symbiobacterium thermophilum IAM 14863]|uniref:Sigma-54-dependent transcriptional regulator variant n=1 Tax=Symbiobacterium thermophilum (strain DSM 24528 / JCM 14929 / IAM 14863 / T) TaxID=292459 RepID=Q67TH7_SYMTH|nr:sigma-54-dependent transcriptional regulator variant [Symbiobacterium thermophilum IAM 14863]
MIDEGIHVVDRNGVTVLYNQQAGQNDGLSPEEVIGRHLLEVFPSLTPATSTLLKVLATGKPIPAHEQTFANYKGQRVTTINSTLPIFHEGELVGAIEVSKDVTRVRELSERVAGLQAALLRPRSRRGAPVGGARYTFDDLVGDHPAMQRLKEQALRAAATDSPVLVYGETGTGKELLVHAIHAASPRRHRPLVAQNCAALPEGLLESLLFGTARGSFTGAEDRPGLFELADGGTLYLDEINSMQPELQAKLLRVLQDGRIRRLGEATERQVDVRIIASTNEEPAAALASGRLRSDLYYRIAVVALEMPPLRRRASDIPLLTDHFLDKHSARLGLPRRPLHPEVEAFFSGTPGRATCASWSTPSRRRCSWPPGRRSGSAISRLPCSGQPRRRSGAAGRMRAGRGPLPQTRGFRPVSCAASWRSWSGRRCGRPWRRRGGT